MRKLKRSIVSWLFDNDPAPRLDFRRESNARFGQEFRIMKGENGYVVEYYDLDADCSRLWVVPEGLTPGQMVDTVLVHNKLERK